MNYPITDSNNIYLKYRFPFNEVYRNLINYSDLIIYIDINSICRGFFNMSTIYNELNYYIENKSISDKFLTEWKFFLNNIYRTIKSRFQNKSIKFILFFDEGGSLQNKAVDPQYKDNRKNAGINAILNQEELELFRRIKLTNYLLTQEKLTKKNISYVVNLKNYESDLVPYFFLENNIINCNNKNTLNLILSNDKDLLQCCIFDNTLQLIQSFKDKHHLYGIYNRKNALNFLMKFENEDELKLTADHLVMLLTLGGDKSDNIKPIIEKFGIKRVYKLILEYSIPPELFPSTIFKLDYLNNQRKNIESNYKMVSFSEQLKRIPVTLLNDLKNKITFNF